ncbi:MAG: hypothetical protein HYU80_00960 [Candidatus Blackburnbacteria bacterium]|nr:hypothetical protein [Candidatus Blackburnbacteria bacterium]
MDDKNLKPLIVSEETPPPPPTVTNGSPSSIPQSPPPPQIPKSPLLSEKPSPQIPQPPKPPQSSENSILPPVITPPSNNKSKTKIIAAIAAVIILAASIPAGIILVSKSQEVREGASAGECRDNPSGAPEGYDWVANCGGSECSSNSDCPSGANNQEGWCYGFEGGSRCLQLVQRAAATPTPSRYTCNDTTGQYCTADRCSDNGDTAGSGSCQESAPNCCAGSRATPTPTQTADGGTGGQTSCSGIENAGPLIHAGGEGINLGNQTYAPCNVVTDFVSRYGTHAGRAWAVERICQPNVAAACDGQNLITQPENVVQARLNQDGASACQNWANQHNTEVNNCQGAGGGVGIACQTLKVYKYPFNANDLLTAPLDGKFKPEETARLCVAAPDNATAGEVKINTANWESAPMRRSMGGNTEFCKDYVIPYDATSLRFQGRVR